MASRFSLPRYRHGHVGMVVGSGARQRIVHAAGNPVAAEAVVVAMPLATFAAEATRITVLRPVHPRMAEAAAAAAEAHVRRRTPFDTEFSLGTPARLYCTELIWRVMSDAAGRDILPVKSLPFGRAAVLLSDLERSPLLAPVASASRGRADR